MSNAKLLFAGEIARFVQMFGGLAAYGEEVGNIGSLEQARAEAEQLVAKAQDELKGLQEQIVHTRRAHQEGCDREKAAADAHAADVKTMVDNALQTADLNARQKIEAAQAVALGIVEQARAQKGGLADEISQAESRLAAVKSEIAAADKKLQAIHREHGAKKSEYEGVVTKHQEFLKSIGAK